MNIILNQLRKILTAIQPVPINWDLETIDDWWDDDDYDYYIDEDEYSWHETNDPQPYVIQEEEHIEDLL
jgi:hypothetical protein